MSSIHEATHTHTYTHTPVLLMVNVVVHIVEPLSTIFHSDLLDQLEAASMA